MPPFPSLPRQAAEADSTGLALDPLLAQDVVAEITKLTNGGAHAAIVVASGAAAYNQGQCGCPRARATSDCSS